LARVPFESVGPPFAGTRGVGAGAPLNPVIALLLRQILPPAKIFAKNQLIGIETDPKRAQVAQVAQV